MFGADTPLVMEALQITALAAVAGGGAIWLLIKRRKRTDEPAIPENCEAGELEQRVRVLERIATDNNSSKLADEIEALRESEPEKQRGGLSQ